MLYLSHTLLAYSVDIFHNLILSIVHLIITIFGEVFQSLGRTKKSFSLNCEFFFLLHPIQDVLCWSCLIWWFSTWCHLGERWGFNSEEWGGLLYKQIQDILCLDPLCTRIRIYFPPLFFPTHIYDIDASFWFDKTLSHEKP